MCLKTGEEKKGQILRGRVGTGAEAQSPRVGAGGARVWGRGQPSSPDGRHAGSVAAEKAGHSPCPQLGIARALRLPLRQTSQALLLACTSTRRKMNNIWSKRKAKINAWIIIVISMEYGMTKK